MIPETHASRLSRAAEREKQITTETVCHLDAERDACGYGAR